mgnify:CR=1 FL=1
MTIQQQALRYGRRRLLKRASRSIPWIGTAIALLTIGSAIRRKGVLRGSLDSALNAIPFVGGLKNAAEVARGQDFLRDQAKAVQHV